MSRPALLKLLNGSVKCPEITTLANLAYAIEDHPYRLVSLYLAGASLPSRHEWKNREPREKKDATKFIRDVTYPDGSFVRAGECITKIWEIANAGDFRWLGRRLVCQDQGGGLYRRVGETYLPIHHALVPERTEYEIPDTAPGEAISINIEFAIPDSPAWVASYWKMVDRQGKLCFPEYEGLRCCLNVMEV